MSSTKKAVISLLDEIKQMKIKNNKKGLKDILAKAKEKFSDVPIQYILEGEINILENKNNQAYYELKKAVSESSKQENKEYEKVASFYFAQVNYELGSLDEAEKILLNIKEEPSKDELTIAIRRTWPTFYTQTFGLLGKINFEKNEVENVKKNLEELKKSLKEKDFKDKKKMDTKSIFDSQKYLLLEVDLLMKEKKINESITKLRELLKTENISIEFQQKINRELSKILIRYSFTEKQKELYDEALTILLKLIQLDEPTETSKDSTIFDDLSILLSSRRYYHRLNEIFEVGLIYKFEDVNIWSQLGYSLLSNFENEKALKVFKECVAMYNSDPSYLFMCSKILLNLNKPKECLEYLKKIDEHYLFLNEKEEKVSKFSFWFGNYFHISGLAYGLLSKNDTSIESRKKTQKIAIEYLLKSNEFDSNNPKLLYHIALQYAETREVSFKPIKLTKLNKIKNAFKFVKLSLDLNSNVESWILLTLLFSSTKDFQKSISCVKTALLEYPNNLKLLLLNARLEEIINENRAFKLYENIFEILKIKQTKLTNEKESEINESEDSKTNLRYSLINAEKIENLTSNEYSNKNEFEKKELINHLLFIADRFRRLQSNKISQEVLERTKKLLNNKMNAEMEYLDGRLFEDESKDVEKIIQKYENALIKNSNHVESLERIGILLASKKDQYILAKSYFQSSLLIDPTLYEIWFQLGNVFKKLGDLEESSNCLITAKSKEFYVGIVLYKDYPPYSDYLTKVYPLTNKIQKVMKVFEELYLSGGHSNESNLVEGLASAYQDFRWREKSEKYLILICPKVNDAECIQPGETKGLKALDLLQLFSLKKKVLVSLITLVSHKPNAFEDVISNSEIEGITPLKERNDKFLHWLRGISIPKIKKENEKITIPSNISSSSTKVETKSITDNRVKTSPVSNKITSTTTTRSPSPSVQPFQRINLLVQNQSDKPSLLCQMNIYQYNQIQSDTNSLPWPSQIVIESKLPKLKPEYLRMANELSTFLLSPDSKSQSSSQYNVIIKKMIEKELCCFVTVDNMYLTILPYQLFAKNPHPTHQFSLICFFLPAKQLQSTKKSNPQMLNIPSPFQNQQQMGNNYSNSPTSNFGSQSSSSSPFYFQSQMMRMMPNQQQPNHQYTSPQTQQLQQLQQIQQQQQQQQQQQSFMNQQHMMNQQKMLNQQQQIQYQKNFLQKYQKK